MSVPARWLLLAAVLGRGPAPAAGHARLMEPPSRASMWRLGYDNPPDFNDHQVLTSRDTIYSTPNSEKHTAKMLALALFHIINNKQRHRVSAAGSSTSTGGWAAGAASAETRRTRGRASTRLPAEGGHLNTEKYVTKY